MAIGKEGLEEREGSVLQKKQRGQHRTAATAQYSKTRTRLILRYARGSGNGITSMVVIPCIGTVQVRPNDPSLLHWVPQKAGAGLEVYCTGVQYHIVCTGS